MSGKDREIWIKVDRSIIGGGGVQCQLCQMTLFELTKMTLCKGCQLRVWVESSLSNKDSFINLSSVKKTATGDAGYNQLIVQGRVTPKKDLSSHTA